MSCEIKEIIGTGLTTCRICNNTIKKGQRVIGFKSYNASGQVHRLIEDCMENDTI